MVAELARECFGRIENDTFAYKRTRRDNILELVANEIRFDWVDTGLPDDMLIETKVGLALAGLSRREDTVEERPFFWILAVAEVHEVGDGDVGHGEDANAVLGLEFSDQFDDGLVRLERGAGSLEGTLDFQSRYLELVSAAA